MYCPECKGELIETGSGMCGIMYMCKECGDKFEIRKEV